MLQHPYQNILIAKHKRLENILVLFSKAITYLIPHNKIILQQTLG